MSSLTGLLRKRRLHAQPQASAAEESAPLPPAPHHARFAERTSKKADDDDIYNLSSDEEADRDKPARGYLLNRAGVGGASSADAGQATAVFPSIRWILDSILYATSQSRERLGMLPRFFPDCVFPLRWTLRRADVRDGCALAVV